MRSEVTVWGGRDERIAAIARLQRGLIARRQLVAAGVGYSSIRWLVGQGRLFPDHDGVFAVGHPAVGELTVETAALLAVRDGAMLSHLSAAALWELIALGDEIHVTVGTVQSAHPHRITVHRSRTLTPADVRIVRALPVTSAARALLDIAWLVTERRLELAYDRGIVTGVVTPTEVTELLVRAGGHPGRGRLAALVDANRHPTVTRSVAEERLLALIRAAGLPAPMLNTRLHGYEVDFYWPAHGLVLELDGFRFHSSRRAFEHDRRKDAVLVAAGVRTMRVTWRQVEGEAYSVIARVAQALALAWRDGGGSRPG